MEDNHEKHKKKCSDINYTITSSNNLIGCKTKIKSNTDVKTKTDSKPKVSAVESAKIMADITVKDDREKSSKFSFYEKMLSNTSDMQKDVFLSAIKKVFQIMAYKLMMINGIMYITLIKIH